MYAAAGDRGAPIGRASGPDVVLDRFARRTSELELAAAKYHSATCQRIYGRHVMSHEEHRPPFACDGAHLAEAFLLKVHIAHGENFIHGEYLRLQMCCDGKGQPDV